MSESTFPFDGAAESQPQAEQDASDSRRPLALVAALAAALVLGAGAFLLLGGDADEAVVLAPSPATAPAAAPQVQEPVLQVVPVAATSPIGRNPFKANYIEPPAAAPTGDTALGGSTGGGATDGGSTGGSTGGGYTGGGSTGGGYTGGGSTGGGGTTGPGLTGGPAPAPPGPGVTPPTGEVPAQSVIVLTGVTDQDGVLTATFTVDGVSQTVAIGASFGARQQVSLVSLHEGPAAAQWTAVIRVGDATPVDMVTGESFTINN